MKPFELLSVSLLVAALVGCTAQTPPPATAPQTPVPLAEIYRATGWPGKTLPELSDALAAGEVTSVELTQAYLDRIALVDPVLQAVLAVNPAALEQARASDARRAAGEALGPLDGIPVLLKDNIETADPGLATTAGSLALKDNVTGRDSPLVAGLRAQGAVILGKTNLSEWANFRSEGSMSGWSALGGQVRNPHVLDRNPCGSSSGSGAAAAASLAAGTVGTETNGSIICPSNVNGIVGFKPTVGLVSQDHIVPISSSQDTAGPMTKTVRGAAMLLTAMTPERGTDYALMLDENALDGVKIGVLRFAQGSNPAIRARFDAALEVLKAQGAETVEIAEFTPGAEGFWTKTRAILDYEFKATITAYLAGSPADIPARSLDDLIAFNRENAAIEMALFDQSIFEQAATKQGLDDPAYLSALREAQFAAGADGILGMMADHGVDVLVSPSGPVAPVVDPANGDVWPDWAGAGYLAAVAGFPHITVPMGEVHGIPVGLSFMAGPEQDADVLAMAYDYEQASRMRVEPAYLETLEARPDIAAAMASK